MLTGHVRTLVVSSPLHQSGTGRCIAHRAVAPSIASVPRWNTCPLGETGGQNYHQKNMSVAGKKRYAAVGGPTSLQGPEGGITVVSNRGPVGVGSSSPLYHLTIVLNSRIWAHVGKRWQIWWLQWGLGKEQERNENEDSRLVVGTGWNSSFRVNYMQKSLL